MKRFYIILAGLFLMALAWELVGQSRQTVYDARWSIGTNSPEATAHVHGNVLIVRTANGESPSLTIRSTTAEGSPAVPAFIMWQPINNTTNVSITTHGEMLLANSLAIGTNSSPLLGVGVGLQLFQGSALFAGNVGIGTNGPVGRLDVVQGTAAGAAIMLYDTNGAIRGRISTLPGASSYLAAWFGTNAVAPSALNYTIASDGGAALLNSAGSTFGVELRQGNALKWVVDGNGAFSGGTLLAGSATVTNRFRQFQDTLTYTGSGATATNVLVDCSLGNWFKLAATNNFHLLFTNIVEGYSAVINVRQDATGSRLGTFNNVNVNTNEMIVFTTTANALDILTLVSDDVGTNINVIAQKNFKH